MVTNFCESANAHLGKLTRVLENEFGDPEHRSLILQQVRELEGFNENEQWMVANRLVKDPKEMELFQGLTRDSRVKFIPLMLASKILASYWAGMGLMPVNVTMFCYIPYLSLCTNLPSSLYLF
ncbi:UNVERIFIED_CONTAM: hypothetical protein Sindi_0464000 [Sesamum indicum]